MTREAILSIPIDVSDSLTAAAEVVHYDQKKAPCHQHFYWQSRVEINNIMAKAYISTPDFSTMNSCVMI